MLSLLADTLRMSCYLYIQNRAVVQNLGIDIYYKGTFIMKGYPNSLNTCVDSATLHEPFWMTPRKIFNQGILINYDVNLGFLYDSVLPWQPVMSLIPILLSVFRYSFNIVLSLCGFLAR